MGEDSADRAGATGPFSGQPNNATGGSRNKTVYLGNEPIVIDKQTTAGELKELAEASVDSDQVLTFKQDGEIHKLNDNHTVFDRVPDGATLSLQEPARSGSNAAVVQLLQEHSEGQPIGLVATRSTPLSWL